MSCSAKNKGLSLCMALCILVVCIGVYDFCAIGEEEFQCWVLCQPKNRVNLRMEPNKDSKCVGWLECGDGFQTDGSVQNGWIKVLDAGECECWIYSGYVVTDEPEEVFENYVCAARKQVACRRWVDGPQYEGRSGWLKNGSEITVFYIAGKWAVTSRGYIQTEWLDADPL